MFVEANICRPDVKAAIMPVAYDLNRLISKSKAWHKYYSGGR